jgi:hypothetical protein
MKLNYRNTSFEGSNPIQLDSKATERPRIKLIYRGIIYNYTPPPVVTSKEDKTNWPTATLIYRGTTYNRKIQPSRLYQKPRTINWRWKLD